MIVEVNDWTKVNDGGISRVYDHDLLKKGLSIENNQQG